MAEYSSMKVPELKKLLAERGLPQTGNKADLCARLQENDKPAEESKEDEISYGDDKSNPGAANPTTEAASTTAAAPAEESTESKTDVKSDEAAVPAEAAAPVPSFAMGLNSTAVDEEAKKRADRAKRFGLEQDEDAKKKVERAERFGIDEKELASGLDSALPERPLKRGRGREGGDGNRPGKRQSLDRRGGRGGRRAGGGGGRQHQGGGQQGDGQGAGRSQKKTVSSVLDDPKEKAKADQRAARFAS